MHPLKRRKLDPANSNLTKPFRSPLRTDAARPPIQSGPELQISQPSHSSDTSQHSTPAVVDDQTLDPTLSASDILSPPLTTIDHAPMPESTDLRKEYAGLGRQLTTLRQSLDTAQQALTIATSQQDAQVRSLIAKWKQVVRDAAEELFEDAKTSYRPVSSQSDRGRPFWEDEDRSQLTQEQREILDVEQEEAKAQAERFGLLDRTESDSEPDSQILTMSMMLQQMNIDLTLVGYDQESQRWVE